MTFDILFGDVEIKTIEKKIQGKKLTQTEKNYLSKSIRPKLIAARIVTDQNILSKINYPISEFKIEYNLENYGFPMLNFHKHKYEILSLEDLIIKILTEKPKARYIEAIPILLIKNNVEEYKLLELAFKFDLKNKIGYLIEIAYMLSKKNYFKNILNYLNKNKSKELKILGNGDENFLMKRTPARMRKWNLLGRFFDDDFKKLSEVYL